MARGQQKQAKKAVEVVGGKNPRIQAASGQGQTLSWRIGSIDAQHTSWGWVSLDMQTLGYIRTKLAAFETMTWNELQGAKHKFIPVENLSSDAKKRLAEIKRDDVDGLYELRFSGVERLWGTRIGDVMQIVWWDPQHEVCPSSLRNT
ncbi:MAG: hypothetical protein JWQ32_3437 [Marmoricola sp.]|nr:hypothetical protein [Marmoricola sp.]